MRDMARWVAADDFRHTKQTDGRRPDRYGVTSLLIRVVAPGLSFSM